MLSTILLSCMGVDLRDQLINLALDGGLLNSVSDSARQQGLLPVMFKMATLAAVGAKGLGMA